MSKKLKRDSNKIEYKITGITEIQMVALIEAIDLYIRVNIGQLEAIVNFLEHNGTYKNEDNSYVMNAIDEIKYRIFGLSKNASYGIGNDKLDPIVNVSYDLLQVLRHRLSWSMNINGGSGISYYAPIKTGTEPLVTCTERKADNDKK